FVIELRDVLRIELDVLVAAFANDALLDVLRTPSRLGLHVVLRRPIERRPCGRVEIHRFRLEEPYGVESEHEADSALGPAIEMARLTEVRVAADRDLAEPGATTELDRLIKANRSALR